MAAFTDAAWSAMRRKLGFPDDATPAQIKAGVDVLIAQAGAVESGGVGTDPVRSRLKLADSAPDDLVLAAVDSARLQAAKSMGMSASAKPGEVKAAAAVMDRAMARVAASSAPAPPAKAARAVDPAPQAGAAPRRVAASTYADPAGVYAANPLVDSPQMRSVFAAAAEAAGGRVPTLFASGDLPVFMASGIDPAVLRSVPWMARHALASEPDRAKALQMFEDLSGPGGNILATSQEFAGHPNNKAYEQRVLEWASTGWAAQDAARDEERRVAASAQAEAVAEAVGPVEEWSDEQCYEHLFGPVDRRKAEEKAREERAIAEGRAITPWTRVKPGTAPR